MRGFSSNDGVKIVHTLEFVILPLSTRLACKRLRVDTDFLLIITSSVDKLIPCTNIDDFKRP